MLTGRNSTHRTYVFKDNSDDRDFFKRPSSIQKTNKISKKFLSSVEAQGDFFDYRDVSIPPRYDGLEKNGLSGDSPKLKNFDTSIESKMVQDNNSFNIFAGLGHILKSFISSKDQNIDGSGRCK